MKIRIYMRDTRCIELDTAVTETVRTPAGGTFYDITYSLNGATVYRVNCGPQYSPPSAIEVLDWTRERHIVCDPSVPGARMWEQGTYRYYARSVTKTHKNWLLDALDSVVLD